MKTMMMRLIPLYKVGLRTLNGYSVDAEFMPILSKIIDKHGDITKNCKGSMEYRSMLLDRICRIVYELDKKNVTNIKDRIGKADCSS
jgi:hypothetical protein